MTAPRAAEPAAGWIVWGPYPTAPRWRVYRRTRSGPVRVPDLDGADYEATAARVRRAAAA